MSHRNYDRFFTDFAGKFHGRLCSVYSSYQGPTEATQTTGTSAQFRCLVKVEYNPELMGLLEEGMLIAVRNFKPNTEAGGERYTLMEVSKVWPLHFGLSGISIRTTIPCSSRS